MTGHGWPDESMGSPQRGHSRRPADSTDSACLENATTWSWLSQKRTLGASSVGGFHVSEVIPLRVPRMRLEPNRGVRPRAAQ